MIQSQLKSFPARPEPIPTPNRKRLLGSLEKSGVSCGMREGGSLLTPLWCRTAVLPATAAKSLQLHAAGSLVIALHCALGSSCQLEYVAQSGCTSKRCRLSTAAEPLFFPRRQKSYLCRLNPLLVSMFFILSPSSDHHVEKSNARVHLTPQSEGQGSGITFRLSKVRGSPTPFWSCSCGP